MGPALSRSPSRRVAGGLAVLALLTTGLVGASPGGSLSPTATQTLEPPSPLAPEDFSASPVDGLQYADPTEGLAVIQPPVAGATGSAATSYPLEVPPGHGITPELAVGYDSGGGNSWMGLGWDLSVGAITVDTTFGAPHFSATMESESYLHDGDLLVPNANDGPWEARTGATRRDFTHQVETEYAEIIRHVVDDGGPDDYFWEVRGRDGGVRWYGGTPDSGGPSPSSAAAAQPTLDEQAVIRDEAGNIVTWLLSAERDIGVNLVRYEYDTVLYAFGEGLWFEPAAGTCPTDAMCGQHTYLDRIVYTDATSAITDFNGPPYEVNFIRETERGGTLRPDPVVDGSGGYLDVLADRLARVEVRHAPPPTSGAARTWSMANDDNVAARWDFAYTTGWFGKTLLSTLTQGVADPDRYVHTLEWFNDLGGAPNTNVTGWQSVPDWQGTDDVATELFLEQPADISALGGSQTEGGGGNVYIGFNPGPPSKTGSFGGALELSGADTDALVEWIDLNGDNLPDKVFTTSSGVSFRLNLGTGGAAAFKTSSDPASGLSQLSANSNFGFQVSFEAYPVVAVGVGIGASFTWSSHYFSDVNGDGLVDFVNGGQVLFNRLGADGIPTFSSSSADTPIPLEPATLPAADSELLDEIDASFRVQSPPIDTVRRWVAPYSGSVAISAPVALDAVGLTTVDGVRVAIQHETTEIAAATLAATSPSAFATDITRTVDAGEALYFRVGSIDDGRNDRVTWSPTITYQVPAGDEDAWPDDANGRSQTTFDAGDDFTLAGLAGDNVVLPFDGTARIEVSLDLATALSDDVELVVRRDDPVWDSGEDALASSFTDIAVTDAVVAQGTTGVTTWTVDVPVDKRTVTTDVDRNDDGANDTIDVSSALQVYVAADTPVDVNTIDWGGTIDYVAAFDDDGAPMDLVDAEGAPIFEHPIRPHVELYPHAAPATPAVQDTLPGSFTGRLNVNALADDPGTAEAIVSFKNDQGVVKVPVTVGDSSTHEFSVDLAPLGGGGDYWVDVSVRDLQFTADGLALSTLDRWNDAAKTTTTSIDGRLRWTGVQDVFPLAWRGWGLAGYTAPDGTAAVAIDPAAFDADTLVDTGDDQPDREDISADESEAPPSQPFVPTVAGDGGTTSNPSDVDAWVGSRASLHGTATRMQSSRLAEDFASLASLMEGAAGSGGRTAPTRLGAAGPNPTLMVGIGPFGLSAGFGPSWGISDFEDLNGDGYPDVLNEDDVTYTNQLGGYLSSVEGPFDYSNQDLTFSVNGGLTSGLVDIPVNAKGGTNVVVGSAAAKGSAASDSGPSFGVGISGGGGFSWTSPNASGSPDDSSSDYADQQDELAADADVEGAAIQRAYADVNGDGLADWVYTTADGTFVRYNLGYSFTDAALQLGTGGFESRESASGSFGLGFSLPWGEFSGGVNFLWNYDWSRYTWRDLNGDGILDQLHRIGEDDVKVRFGTGSGLLDPISYGDVFDVNLDNVTTSGQHLSFDRSTGIGAGGSGTAYIGPLCVVGVCYLVINIGANGSQSRSSTTTDLADVDGDGYADVLRSTDDDVLEVKRNAQGRTNLLQAVTNPLGGSFELDYTRIGNTTDHPGSVWAMTSVTVDDGRDVGEDGIDVYGQTIAYEGLAYDRTHRASLGFSRVTTTEVDGAGTPLRVQREDFLNDDVFVAGLQTASTLLEPDGTPIRGSEVTWGLRDVQGVASDFDPRDPVTLVAPGDLTDTSTVASRGRSLAPLATSNSQFWFDDTGARTFEQVVDYVHDGLGNVLVETDHGSADTTDDDVVTTVTWSDCTQATVHGCLPTASATSPLAGPGTCINWASYPGHVRVQQRDDTGALTTVRERSGMKALCDNGAVTEHRLVVDDGGGTRTVAVTDLTVNAYGDHELVMAPPGIDGTRYTVRYTYDADRHTDIAEVEEFDVATADAATVLANGPTAATATAGISSSATFDPLSGRAASRTDANGATRHWRYDGLGRLTQVSDMMPTAAATPTWLVTQRYHTDDADYAHAIATHVDVFDGNATPTGADADGHDATATIDTVMFVDGLGRVTQTKRDARMRAPGATTAHNGRQVTGTQAFDTLARPVVDYGPVVDDGPAADFTAAADDGKQTTTTYDLADRTLSETLPSDTLAQPRTTTWEYSFTRPDPADPLLWTVVETDPEQRGTTVGMDIRGNQLVHMDTPAPRTDAGGAAIPQDPPLTTRWDVNAIGEVTAITDSTGEVTTIEHDLAGQPTAVTTPNQGRVETSWDLAGRRARVVNELMRANGTATTYDYELNRLVAVDHPGTVDDIAYEYGLGNTDGRHTAGRVARVDDRSRIVDYSYDALGNLAAETVETKRHNWSPTLTEEEREEFRSRMAYGHDPLGRIATVTYPDAKTVQVVPAGTTVADLTDPAQLADLLVDVDQPGEVVTHDYDSGGMVDGITGSEEGVVVAPEPINAFDDAGVQLTVDVPRLATHDYEYLGERVYDHRMLPVREEMGNTTITTRTFHPDTKWLTEQVTTAADPADPSARLERQDMAWTFDAVGRPLTYANELPDANRAINGGAITMAWTYDGFGRMVDGTGSFSLKEGDVRSHTYAATFTPDAPWSIVAKDQHDQLATTKPNGDPGKVEVQEDSTYAFARTLGTADGPLRVADDVLTDADGEDTTYEYTYNANGAVESMLAPGDTGGNGRGNNKGGTSETNVWDRAFTFNQLNQLTSASDGSELRTFSYDDTGGLFIQDGSLLTDTGSVVHESGGGPETVFLNRWVTIRSNKIYKHVWVGSRPMAVQMDSGADYESKQLYAHDDLVGSTNIVTDDVGRGFQRHEYLPSGEIWIDDRKEEIRTPFQFANGYYEDEFDIVLFGTRWYDTERELFLSPDPLLVDEPSALLDTPALGAAYTYAGAAPTSNVDPSGRAFFSSWGKRDAAIRAEQDFNAEVQRGRFGQTEIDDRNRRLKKAKKAKKVQEPNALLIIDFEERETSVGFLYGKRKKWPWGDSSTAAQPGGNNQAGASHDDSSDSSLASSISDSGALSSAMDDSSDATNGSGGPNVGGRSRADSSASEIDASSLDEFGASSSEEEADSIDDLFDALAGAGAGGRRSVNLDDYLDASMAGDSGSFEGPLRDSRGDN